MIGRFAELPTRAITEFFRLESAGGLLLVAMVAVALILSNSPAADFYRSVIDLPMAAYAGGVGLEKMLVHWVNDGLMAVFFLLVGLEIKREIKDGELSSRDQVLLPAAAAVGGMAVLALVYVLFNMGDEIAMRGWAIPAATDIAFSLGVIALLGRRVPISLKVFLTALAILDDLGAIIIIAIFYTAELSAISLGVAGACVIVLIVLNRIGVERLSPYVLVGLVLWFAVLESGVHATLAGVLLGLCIPLHGRSGGDAASPLRQLEQRLHPWVAYLILPLFALLNAGVSFSGAESGGVFGAVPLGIALGLFVGKQVGIFGMAWLLIRFGICRLPEGANWKQLYGVAVLTEIGFTMSLFIGGLAFEPGTHESDVRIGVLMGSIVSAVTGYVLLRAAGRNEGAHRSSMA